MSNNNSEMPEFELYDATFTSGEHSMRVRNIADMDDALTGFARFLASLPAARVPRAPSNGAENPEEETALAEKYRQYGPTKKNFRNTAGGTRLEGLRQWWESLSDEMRAAIDGGEEMADSARITAPPEMSEAEAEAHL